MMVQVGEQLKVQHALQRGHDEWLGHVRDPFNVVGVKPVDRPGGSAWVMLADRPFPTTTGG